MAESSTELTMIDAGISTLSDLPLPTCLTYLNLHCNHITTIQNLQHLQQLQHLDLSSNQIKAIKGLDKLINLKTLNLACNQIKKVQGVSQLRKLIRLNLSYNCIEDLAGFLAMSGPEYKLERLDLQGNRVSLQKNVIDSLSGCMNLKTLSLRCEGADNPVCSSRGYRQNVARGLRHVEVLDGTDRAGNVVGGVDVPGLEDYLAQILPSSSSEAMALETPNIDAVIDSFRQRQQADSGASLGTPTATRPTTTPRTTAFTPKSTTIGAFTATPKSTTIGADSTHSASHSAPANTDSSDTKSSQKQELDRLHRIEQQLSKLLQLRDDQKKVAKRDTDLTDESDNTDPPKHKRKIPQAKLSRTPPSRRTIQPKQPTAKAEDMKKELETTYQHLIEDLNTERERRFRAEHAAKQLAERVKQLQIDSKVIDEKQGIAIEAGVKLKEAVEHEREKCRNLEEENSGLKEELLAMQNRLEQSTEAHQVTLTAVRSLEESVAKIESEKVSGQAHFTKLLHDAESRASANHREIDLLRVQLKDNKKTIQQLQQLLASREQEHQKELDARYTLASPEIRELLQKEACHVEAKYQGQIANLESSLESSNRKYSQLEDEFRDALYIEASRYNKVHEAFEKIRCENEENRMEVMNLKNKDEKGTQLITELTQLVKEQKGRITELAKSKHDQIHDQKDRIQALEAHLEEARRRLVQYELLKKDNQRLQAQYDGQQSVIEGLRAERKLWSQELAQQGSSLAQDRGRLEAKIEANNHEIAYLKKQLEKEIDSLKIKSKLIEDQTDSIRSLKEALLERDDQVKTVRQEMLDVQKKLENELCDEKQAYRDAQEMIDDLTQRKEQLKKRVQDLENDIQIERENHETINDKWKEKSELIGRLENQVFDMKSGWEKKEKELENEKDKAMRAANLAIDKMRQMDAAFKKQYENTKRSHEVELERVVKEKEAELEEAMGRVREVESEMRMLLKEQEESKRLAEERLKKMGEAFSQLQEQLV